MHYYEAVLATLAIIVWHFYFTIFNPEVFPVSKAMITGELTREQINRSTRWSSRNLIAVKRAQTNRVSSGAASAPGSFTPVAASNKAVQGLSYEPEPIETGADRRRSVMDPRMHFGRVRVPNTSSLKGKES